MKLPKPALVVCLLLISACTFTSSYINREVDKSEAEQVTNQLFLYLKNKNYDATYSLYSKEFWSVTDKEKLMKLYSYTQDKLGDLEDTNLSEWETKVVTGTTSSGDYAFLYKNKYQKDTAEVTIKLTKDPDHKVRIVAFHINSGAFLAK
jgi:hypothetical protein